MRSLHGNRKKKIGYRFSSPRFSHLKRESSLLVWSETAGFWVLGPGTRQAVTSKQERRSAYLS